MSPEVDDTHPRRSLTPAPLPATAGQSAGPPVPIGEAARLADLLATTLLDTEHDGVFDGIVRTASYVTGTPTALITLIDEHRQWFKARVGLELESTDRCDAFCAYAILEPGQTLQVADATLDERFRENPFVKGAPGIRFYCGVPITSAEGRALGTVCVLDSVPRELDVRQLQALEDLAHQTSALIQAQTRVRALEERTTRDDTTHVTVLRTIAALTESATNLDSLLECSLDAIVHTLDFSAGGLWWHDGENLAVDPLWIDAAGAAAGMASVRQGLAYPADLLIHTHETATRHGPDVLPAVITAILQRADIEASYAVPIIAGGTTIGAFEVLPAVGRTPSPRSLLAATQAAAEVGRWIEHDRSPQWVHAVSAPAPTLVHSLDPALIRRRAAIKAKLAGAVARGDLSVIYEPIVDLTTDTTTAVEVLARWHDAELGTIGPDEFIPLAEESGVIGSIGRFVRDQALRDLPRLESRMTDSCSIWLNVSPQEIDAAYAQELLSELAKRGVEPRRLTLEVTERMVVSADHPALEHLVELAAAGVGIAVDDFGSGFTSLTQLRTLPLTRIKIDRSFTAELVGQHAARMQPIVHGLVQLCHTLGLEVVAEGIETTEQLAIVRELGADLAQGHLLTSTSNGLWN